MAQVHQIQTLQQSCEDCPIRNRAVCSYSTRDELAELNAAKFYRDYRAGSEIVGESELMSSLGSIVTGVVALQKTLEDGRRQMVGLLFPSDFIGRPLRSQAPYEAVAVTDVRMCMFQRQKFEQILRENVSLERRLLEITLDELDAARDWMLLLGRKTAREKIASFLMILARRARSSDGGSLSNGSRIQIPLSREAIAEYIGLTIETVSRQISGLRKDGLIDLPDKRSVVIRHIDHLRALAGEEVHDYQDSASF